MAANIRGFEEDFEMVEEVEPVDVNLGLESNSTRKGLLKLSLSITYFLVLVFFLFKLLS